MRWRKPLPKLEINLAVATSLEEKRLVFERIGRDRLKNLCRGDLIHIMSMCIVNID